MATDQLEEIDSIEKLYSQWEDVLSTENLNKNFYRELFNWYQWAVDKCKFPNEEKIKKEEQVIRLITRLLFIWFLKEKKLVDESMFEEEFARREIRNYTPEETHYYRAVLQNLFFATLNTEIGKRKFYKESTETNLNDKYRYKELLRRPDQFVDHFKKIPFVNGGLFECLDKSVNEKTSEVDYFVDAFCEETMLPPSEKLDVPAYLFFSQAAKRRKGLFDLLRSYKFTIEENTPVEQEVALDPELLGLVFENLLAAYNPETKETARKSTGSFYTPRQVVEYMVDETIAYSLAAKISSDQYGINERSLNVFRSLLDYKQNYFSTLTTNETVAIVKAISEIRILDPSVGSGAFPICILHKLNLILTRIDPDNQLWLQTQKKQNANGNDKSYQNSGYDRKLLLIQKSIFGVDIQPIACQIAKLRMFITLLVEQNPNDDPDNNFGIEPLPNLETRFVCANTLYKLYDQSQLVLGYEQLLPKIKALREIREEYFGVQDKVEKKRLISKDKNCRNEIAEELKELSFGHDNADAIAEWDPYNQNGKAEWFEPIFMFGVTERFDTIIGNPPYIKSQNIKDKSTLSHFYSEIFEGSADIFVYFFGRGIELLKERDGLICYITSNKFLLSHYGKKLRKYLLANTKIHFIIDSGMTGTFKATVRPSIVLAQQNLSSDFYKLKAAYLNEALKLSDLNWFEMCSCSLSFDGWRLTDQKLIRLKDKIIRAGCPLKDKYELFRGIETGCNKAFIIDEKIRSKLLKENPKNGELIYKVIRGKSVRRWSNRWHKRKNEYIIVAQGVEIENYPAIKRHLEQYKKELNPKNRIKIKRFEFSQYPAKLFREKSKLVFADIAPFFRGFIDNEQHYLVNSAFAIPGDHEFLLALLHSKTLDFYFRMSAKNLNDPFHGGEMRFLIGEMKNTPIPCIEPNSKVAIRLSELARKIQHFRQKDSADLTVKLQQELNKLVYKLYGLNKEDISLIEEISPLTDESE